MSTNLKVIVHDPEQDPNELVAKPEAETSAEETTAEEAPETETTAEEAPEAETTEDK